MKTNNLQATQQVEKGFFKVPNSFFDDDRKEKIFYHFCDNTKCHFVKKDHYEQSRWDKCPGCGGLNIKTENLSVNEKATLLYFYRCGNGGTEIFPSFKTIARVCGFSESTAKRVVQKITRMKLLTHTRNASKEGSWHIHNEYQLHYNDIERDDKKYSDKNNGMKSSESGGLKTQSQCHPDHHLVSQGSDPSVTVTLNEEPVIKNPNIYNPVRKSPFSATESVAASSPEKNIKGIDQGNTREPGTNGNVLPKEKEVALEKKRFGKNGLVALTEEQVQWLLTQYGEKEFTYLTEALDQRKNKGSVKNDHDYSNMAIMHQIRAKPVLKLISE